MKKTDTSKDKRILLNSRGSKEYMYYIVLFAIALGASIGIYIYGNVKANPGLVSYSCFLMPLFVAAELVVLKLFSSTVDPVYEKNGVLCIKKRFFTRKIALECIKKVAISTSGKDNVTTVKFTTEEKAYRYNFKNVSKEDVANLRKLIK